ncbi:hypothetical protein LINGRAHAP2_LOCUS11716, partial [Linum grandiflorum]
LKRDTNSNTQRFTWFPQRKSLRLVHGERASRVVRIRVFSKSPKSHYTFWLLSTIYTIAKGHVCN